MPAVAVRLLGGFAATVDGKPVPDTAWRLKKARELVKMLALAPGHQLHREQAMDVLWGDRDPVAAANNLHQALHVVRRVLGSGTVVLHDGRLSLDSDIDVDRLHRAARHAQATRTADAYHSALSLYRGPLLPENRYDDWAAQRREELAGLHAVLTRELAGLQSRGWAAQLPSDASSFIGRGRELAELTALLGHTRLLTLTGVGGAGKTRLALQLARGVQAAFPDGAALVELAPLAVSRLVPAAVAGALEVQAMPGRTLEGALADFVSARTMLLVLDNCEHVLAGCAPLADVLLRRAPGLTILATSREPLRVPGEVVFRVPSLGIPDPEQVLSPQRLLGYEAMQLLVERAAAALPGFEVTTQNAADLTRICFRLDGLPLALELAAARLATLGPTAIAERLDDRFRLLRAHSRVAPTRQQTLAATLDWSHDLLDGDERVLFRRLAAFTGAFDLPEVEVVCSDPALDVPQIADLLGLLVDKSLVVRDRQARNPPYLLLETVRAYAQDRLSDAGELHELQRRHADWALRLAELEQGSTRLDGYAANLRTAFDTLLTTSPEDALRCCLALLPFWLRRIDLAAAHRRFCDALAGRTESTPLRARALLAAAAIELRRGAYGQGIDYSRASLAIAVELADPRAQWDAVQLLGEFALVDDRAQDAQEWLEQGLQIARRQAMVAAEAIGIYSLGVARSIIDDLPGAEHHLARSAALLRTLAGSGERVPSPVNIGELRSPRSDRPGLRLVFEETRKPFADLSCDAALGYVLANHASIARMRGDPASAQTLLDRSAECFARTRNERGQVDVLVRRAYLCLHQGSLPAARAHLQEALARRQAFNDRRGVGLVLAGLGLLETTAGDYPAAENHLAQACDLFRRAGDRWGLIGSLWRTADLATERGRFQDADAALREALIVVNETGRERWIAQTLAAMAETALVRGDTDRARTTYLDARDRFALTQDAPAVAAVQERLRDLAQIR